MLIYVFSNTISCSSTISLQPGVVYLSQSSKISLHRWRLKLCEQFECRDCHTNQPIYSHWPMSFSPFNHSIIFVSNKKNRFHWKTVWLNWFEKNITTRMVAIFHQYIDKWIKQKTQERITLNFPMIGSPDFYRTSTLNQKNLLSIRGIVIFTQVIFIL